VSDKAAKVGANEEQPLQTKRLQLCRWESPGLSDRKELSTLEKWLIGDKTPFEEYLQNLCFQKVTRAWGIIVRVKQKTQTLIRTNDQGGFLYLKPGEEESEELPPDKQRYTFYSGEEYKVFWSYSAGAFHEARKLVDKDLEAAFSLYPWTHFVVELDPTRCGKLSRGGWTLMPGEDHSHEKTILYRTLFHPTDEPRRFHTGKFLTAIKRRSEHAGIPSYGRWVVADCRTVDAVYATELLHHHLASLRKKTADQYAIFEHFADLVESSQLTGIPGKYLKSAPYSNAEMASARKGLTKYVQRKYPGKSRHGTDFLAYALRVATNEKLDQGTEAQCKALRKKIRKAFSTAIPQVSHTAAESWKEGGEIIRSLLGEDHPNDFDNSRRYLSLDDKKEIQRYYDFFRFGREHEVTTKGALQHLRACQEQLDKAMKSIQGRVQQFGKKRFGQPLDLFVDIPAFVPEDKQEKFLQRALDARQRDDVEWAGALPKSADPSWGKIKAYIEGVAGWTNRIQQGLQLHFSYLDNIAKYQQHYQEINQIGAWLNKLKDLDGKLFQGKPVRSSQRIAGTDIDFSFEARVPRGASSGIVEVKVKGQKVLELTLLSQEVGTETVTRQAKNYRPRQGSKRVRRKWKKWQAEVPTREVWIKKPNSRALDEYKNVPKWLGATASALTLWAAVGDFCNASTLGGGVEAFVKLGQGVLGSAEAVAAAASGTEVLKKFEVVSKYAPLVTEFTKKAGAPMAALDIYFNLKEGIPLLFLMEDSASGLARQRGDEVECLYLRTKGGVLVTGTTAAVVWGGLAAGGAAGWFGAVGAVAAGEAAGTVSGLSGAVTVGAGASGPILAGTTVAVFSLGVGYHIWKFETGNVDNAYGPIADALHKAMNAEFTSDLKAGKHKTLEWVRAFDKEVAALRA